MATLNAMFRIYDKYSVVVDKITGSTNRATDRMLKLSGATDNFNNELNETERNVNKTNNSLNNLIGTFISFVGLKKGTNIVDNFTNTSARLNLINDGLQTQLELQNKIFAAADRSRGSYNDMSNAISKMGLMAGDSFTSNDELIGFTELLQKSFKVGGASDIEQSSGMLQLTQAMAAGKLQGDEFRSIMENAPMLAQAISDYMGVTKGELKDLSSEGVITSDIIKNAMFMAGDDINAKFETMPITFADIGNKISNGLLQSFRPAIDGISKIINNQHFQSWINVLMGSLFILGNVFGVIFNFIADNFNYIMPLVLGGLATIVAKLWSMIPPLIAQATAWLVAYWPIFLVFTIIGMVIAVLIEFGFTFEDIFGFIGGSINVLIGVFQNFGIAVWNVFKALGYGLAEWFVNLVNGFITGINAVIGLLNKIKGVEIQTISHLENKFTDSGATDFVSLADKYNQGSTVGKNIYGSLSEKLGSFSMDKYDLDFSDFGTTQNPLNITSKDNLQVDISKENLQYLRDIAEREYVNKFSTATLAPQVVINVAEVKETADLDEAYKRAGKLLAEEIAIVSEGVYD